MNYLQHPLSADKLLNHAWRGHRGDGGPEVIVGTYLSAKYPGFIHFEVCDMGTQQRVWSKRPATPDFVLGAIDHELKPLGLCVAKLRWRYSANKPHDWDTHKLVMDALGSSFTSCRPVLSSRSEGPPGNQINASTNSKPGAHTRSLWLLMWLEGQKKKLNYTDFSPRIECAKTGSGSIALLKLKPSWLRRQSEKHQHQSYPHRRRNTVTRRDK